MGCGGSKVDEPSLVVMCRERKQYLKAASEYRFALAASHVAYFHSLGDIGDAILRFAEEELPVGSPVLRLPSGEGKLSSPSSSSSLPHVLEASSSNRKPKEKKFRSPDLHSVEDDGEDDPEGSHLHLSPSTEEGSATGSGAHGSSGNEEREHGYESYDTRPAYGDSYGGNYSYFPPREPPPAGVWGYNYPGSAAPFPYPYSFSNTGPPPYPPYDNPNFRAYYMRKTPAPARTVFEIPATRRYSDSGYYGGESSSGYTYSGIPRNVPDTTEIPRRPPPPTPPSPKSSAWDFFNVFEGIDGGSGGYYPEYYPGARYGYGSGSIGSSPDSNEVREREGIPQLEDEADISIIKEVDEKKEKKHDSNIEEGGVPENKNFHGGTLNHKPPPMASTSGSGYSVSAKGKGIANQPSPESSCSSDSSLSMSPEEEEEISQFVNKKGVSFEVEEAPPVELESSRFSSVTSFSNIGSRDLKDVVMDVRKEFESATGSGKEVAVMLEVGKLPYYRRTTLLKVFISRILHLLTSHPSSTTQSLYISSRTLKIARTYTDGLESDSDFENKCLSSTLQQLYAWEKKLYKEVKDEERLRSAYDKLCKRLQSQDRRGAEPSKIDATRAGIATLLTKINVCIRAVDAISTKINKLRDEELLPQIVNLIYGLIRMWTAMRKCHQKQVEAMMESKVRHLRANTGAQGLKATIDLESEVMNWCSLFNKWIISQKKYIQSLNEWLSRCLSNPDGPSPFSPSREGAPPIFVICNDWHQAMVSISEKTVEHSMIDFAAKLHELWERVDKKEVSENVRKTLEKRLESLRAESQMMDGAKVMPRMSDSTVDLDAMLTRKKKIKAKLKAADAGSVQGGLVPIFEALGNFAADFLKAHEKVRLDYSAGVE